MSTKAPTLEQKKNVGSAIVRFSKEYMYIIGILLLTVVFSVACQIKYGEQYFLTWDCWNNILLQTSTVAIVALGQSIILLTGAFDMSLGRMVCLTSCVGAYLMKNAGVSMGAAITIMFALGIALGCLNGFMVSYVGIPAFIATLGTQYVCYGVAKLLTQAKTISGLPAGFEFLGQTNIFGILPLCVVIMVVLYIVAQFITSYTKIGRNLYAVGGSREAAFFSGINVKLYVFGTFVLSGFLAAFGGLILTSKMGMVAVTHGQNYEFDAVIGSIIGGVSLAGGKGRVIGTMFGCIFLNALFYGFNMMGVDPFVQDVLKGIVLVLAITLDVINSNRKKKS